MTLSKARQAEIAEEKEQAIKKLRDIFKPGDTVTTVIRHVSRSGMSRSISVIDTYWRIPPDVDDVSYLVARALGDKVDQRNGGVVVGGCGMDMGFHLVYSLSRTLYREGFECIGRNNVWCNSNDHSNGDRDYTPHMHSDGGYALNQRWL